MIDFPASPTDGQIFSAPNGVIYKWSATYSSWLAQNPAPPLGGTGDFMATLAGGAVPTTPTTALPATIVSGNSGLWYSTSTGRYTPPAGRFRVSAQMTVATAGTANTTIAIRKNGAVVATGSGTATTAFYVNNVAEGTFDANGSDWFDVQYSIAGGSATLNNLYFNAFPLTGMQGPTGPAGSLGNGLVTAYGGFTPVSGTAVVIVFGTVINGNSGSWLNLANGRYTPPVGKYFIQCNGTIQAPAGGNGGWTLTPRKNGTAITGAGQIGTGAASFNVPITVGIYVDANGTDFFEFTGIANVASMNNIGSVFTAFQIG